MLGYLTHKSVDNLTSFQVQNDILVRETFLLTAEIVDNFKEEVNKEK